MEEWTIVMWQQGRLTYNWQSQNIFHQSQDKLLNLNQSDWVTTEKWTQVTWPIKIVFDILFWVFWQIQNKYQFFSLSLLLLSCPQNITFNFACYQDYQLKAVLKYLRFYLASGYAVSISSCNVKKIERCWAP